MSTQRGKTTPASTGGSFAAHAGARSRVAAPDTSAVPFEYNGDRYDFEQVAPYFDDYARAVQDAIQSDGITRLNTDVMRGRVPAIAGPDENAALRVLRRSWHLDWQRRGLALAEANYDAYVALYDEITGSGNYPHSRAFKGRIPGLAGATDRSPDDGGTLEDHVIYHLREMRSRRIGEAQFAAFIAEGAEPINTVTGTEPFKKVMCHGFNFDGTGTKVYENVHLQAPTKPGDNMGIIAHGTDFPYDYTGGTVIGIR